MDTLCFLDKCLQLYSWQNVYDFINSVHVVCISWSKYLLVFSLCMMLHQLCFGSHYYFFMNLKPTAEDWNAESLFNCAKFLNMLDGEVGDWILSIIISGLRRSRSCRRLHSKWIRRSEDIPRARCYFRVEKIMMVDVFLTASKCHICYCKFRNLISILFHSIQFWNQTVN